MMLAKIRALRQFSFGCFVRRTRRMRTARKKRCAIPLTRSKELFQPDARSDLPHLGPGLRPGRCGRVGSPEGSRAERIQWMKQRRRGWRCAPVFASARRGAPQKAAKRERTKGESKLLLCLAHFPGAGQSLLGKTGALRQKQAGCFCHWQRRLVSALPPPLAQRSDRRPSGATAGPPQRKKKPPAGY